jgi:hypothetical protein
LPNSTNWLDAVIFTGGQNRLDEARDRQAQSDGPSA